MVRQSSGKDRLPSLILSLFLSIGSAYPVGPRPRLKLLLASRFYQSCHSVKPTLLYACRAGRFVWVTRAPHEFNGKAALRITNVARVRQFDTLDVMRSDRFFVRKSCSMRARARCAAAVGCPSPAILRTVPGSKSACESDPSSTSNPDSRSRASISASFIPALAR